jgi:hypothetical protein
MNDAQNAQDRPAGVQRGISRRSILKLTSAVAVAAGAGGLTLKNFALPQSAGAAVGDVIPAGNFRVEIPGAPEASANVESVSINDLRLDIRLKPVRARDEFGSFRPGDAHFGSVTIKAFAGPRTGELQQWFEQAAAGENAFRNVLVIAVKDDGTAARTFNLFDCYPMKWDPGEYSPVAAPLTETIICKIGRVELA